MPYPTADILINQYGVAPELASIIGGTDPMPTAADLMGLGMPDLQAEALGAVAYAARPKDYNLIGLGMEPYLATVLGQP